MSVAARAILLLGAAASLWVAWRHAGLSSARWDRWTEPRGYRDLVNRGLSTDLARVAIPVPDDRIAIGGGRSPGEEVANRVEIYAAPARIEIQRPLSSAELVFAARSFLLEDLRHPERFRIASDGKSAALLPQDWRRRALPFSDAGRYRGRVLLRGGGATPTLVSLDGWRLRLRPGAESYRVATEAPRRPPASGDDPVLSAGHFTWSVGGEAGFDVHAIPADGGRTTAVLGRPTNAAGRLRHNGATLGDAVLRPLGDGDWLVFEALSRREVLHVETSAVGVLSELRATEQGAKRIVSPIPGLEELGVSLGGALDVAVSRLTALSARNRTASGGPIDGLVEALAQRDIQLSFAPEVHAAAQGALAATLHARMPTGGWSLRGGTIPRLPPRASLVVLSLDGQLLGAGTYPTDAQLDDHLERQRAAPQLDERLVDYVRVEAEQQRPELVRNHAFSDHQIGSTVKPLFGAALALQHRPEDGPDPLEVEVECHGGSELGPNDAVPLVPGTDVPLAVYQDHVHGAVDFTAFLARSCHSYMFRLGAMALTRTEAFTPASCDGDLGNVLATALPAVPAREDVERMSPLSRFRWLVGASLRRPESPGDESWWEPLAGEIAHAWEQVGCDPLDRPHLGGLSPAEVDLDMQAARRCHPHFSSFLKGGWTNRWSSADLAVAYARLLTGRPIEGRLLAGDSPPAPGPGCDRFLGCDDPERYTRVRDEVLGGMAAALRGGTARALRPGAEAALVSLEAATGHRWGAYAKTGTSTLDVVAALAVNDELVPTKEVAVELPVANLVFALVECADPGDARRAQPLACDALPGPGTRHRGVVVQLWVRGAPEVTGGGDAAALLGSREGRVLFERIAEHLEPGE